MSLQIRRGPTSDRLTITPVEGELIYDTTQQSLYVGDGTTVGGRPVSAGSPGNVEDIAASLFTTGIHSNINYTYDSLNNRINSAVDLTTYSGIINSDGFQGNLYAYDDSLLVDGVLKSFNLNGTVRTDVVPNSDDVYDLGSFTNRFRDLYLSGSSLYLGDAIVNAIGPSVNLPAGSTVGGVPIEGGGIIEGGTYQINIAGIDSSLILDSANSSINAPGGVRGNILANDFSVIIDTISKSIDAPGGIRGDLVSDDFSTIIVNSTNGSINAPGGIRGNILANDFSVIVDAEFGSINAPGGIQGDLVGGSIFGADSSLLVDGNNGQIVGDINARLGGDLDVNNFKIVGSTVEIAPLSHTIMGSQSLLRNGAVSILRFGYSGTGYGTNTPLRIAQVSTNTQVDKQIFVRGRTSGVNLVPVNPGDVIGEISFVGESMNPFNGSQFSASIRSVVDAAVSGNTAPGRIDFLTNDGSGLSTKCRISNAGVLEVSTIRKLSFLDVGLTVEGDLVGSVFLDDSTKVIDGITGSVTATSFVQFGSLTTIERNALSAVNGMVIYNTTNDRFEGYQNGAWINLDDGTPAGA